MLSESIKKRLIRDRPTTSITLRIPVEVVESFKSIAPHKGYAGYQPLLKAYLSEGLRRDEVADNNDAVERLKSAEQARRF